MADEFSEQVKRALASRVGNLCSSPECRALTSGPQENPAKSLNIGVAAHITAASPGGSRYDPELLPEERCAPSNGLWLCQNCAKLVDNDASRFTVSILRDWKVSAENEARSRVGKTAPAGSSQTFDLKVYERVRIEPIIPQYAARIEWMVESSSGGCFVFEKTGSQSRAEIPSSFIEKVHRFGSAAPLVQLAGRLQWNSVSRQWQLMSEKPEPGPKGEHGFSRYVDFDYPRRMNYAGGFAWCREDQLARCLSQGRYVFYDEDGKFLRVCGPDIDQILVSESP